MQVQVQVQVQVQMQMQTQMQVQQTVHQLEGLVLGALRVVTARLAHTLQQSEDSR